MWLLEYYAHHVHIRLKVYMWWMLISQCGEAGVMFMSLRSAYEFVARSSVWVSKTLSFLAFSKH